jgi:hypothetical protein
MIIPANLTGKDLFAYLIKNKSLLLAAKKSTIKFSDVVSCPGSMCVNDKGEITKADNPIEENATKLNAALVINTTNWFDSHKDVHIPGIWKKSLTETKDFYLLKEHTMSFENVISDEVTALAKKIPWKELGYEALGNTEALVFNTIIDAERHPYMFSQYKKGYVKNHSVGMRYVKIKLAINDEDYKEEFSVWNQYIDEVINRADAEASGYFWAVLEAKVVEGSAVLKGSNRITPVYSIQSSKEHSTEEQPLQGTESNQPQGSGGDPDKSEVAWERIAELFN